MAINKNKVMDAARKARDKGQVDKAIKEYLKIVREDPKDVRVWLKIGDLYAKKSAKAEATDTYLRVAKFYSEQGFYLKAVAVYKQILKLDPRLVEVNLKLAELYRQLGLLSDAMQHFEMVAAFFHREGKTREALATIRQLVDLDPENVATRIKLAELYSKEGMVEDAVTEFGHACEYLRKHNRLDDFIKVAERLLWHKPDNVPLNRELANLYLRRSDPRRALQKLQTCFKSDPRDIDTLGLLAQAFQALDQKGKTVSVLKEMARVLVEIGKRREAEEVHKRILGFVPSDPDSRAFLGDAASQARAAASPAPVAEQVLEPTAPPPRRPAVRGMLNPTGSMPLVMQSQELDAVLQMEDGGDEDYGIEVGEPARSAADGDFIAELSIEADAYDMDSSVHGEQHAEEIVKILTETDVYVKYGLHQKAIDHLGKVFRLDPMSREARERLKDIYFMQGRTDEAIVELCRLAEQCGGQEPDRAELYLREVMRFDANNGRALELAERYRIDMSDSEDVEIVEGGPRPVGDGSGLMVGSTGIGARAAGSGASPAGQGSGLGPVHAGDELDFDDLDLDSDEVATVGDDGTYTIDDIADEEVVPSAGNAAHRLSGVIPAEPMPRATSSRFESDGFEFELGDEDEQELGSAEIIPEFEDSDPGIVLGEAAGATVEVAMDQVEEAVSIADLDSDDLDFDAAPVGSDPLSPIPRLPERHAAGHDVGEDLPFDPYDARLFDAEPGFDEDGALAPGFMADEPSEDALDAALEDPEDEESIEPVEVAYAGELPESYEFGVETGPVTPPDPVADRTSTQGRTIETSVGQGQEEGGEEAAGGTSLEDDLDEADFFVGQGLWEEARDILRSLLQRYPQHPLAMAKLRDVEAMSTTGEEEEPPQRLSLRAARAGQPPGGGRGPHQVSAPVRPVRPVVLLENPVEDSDADTHFDLGLAYKEMGLHDEAIKAFQKVLTSTRREVQSHMMIGLCHREQGNLSEAINQFKAGLYVEKITTAEKFGLY
ncbi:MAG TPA: tetratricopeptide repeat protein [Kofleriaceae bacterium]|nr:tetratricopeptide repeat protein [Kofleriaceae bacterium]